MYAQSKITSDLLLSAMPPDYFRIINPATLRQSIYRDDPLFNATWDIFVTPEGRVFAAICAELNVTKAAKFCEYLPATGEFRECFDVGRVILPPPRSMPPSKIHTSMSLLPDGRIIMTTHTTAASPGHPAWMIDGYYNHLWEGYQGSCVLIFDPQTGQVENLGMPVPRDSIYGGAYDAKHHRYYFTTWIRGMVYGLDLESREVTEVGQISEFGLFRLLPGSDGHLYGASRTGRISRINVDRVCLEDTGLDIPYDATNRYARTQRMLTYGATGPDGALYFTACFTGDIFRYDLTRGTVESLGGGCPAALGEWNHTRLFQGMVFDRHDVLWYTCTDSLESDHLGTHLVSWDLNGGQPVNHGLIGPPERVAVHVGDIRLHGDTLYVADTNHGEDPPAMVRIELEPLRGEAGPTGPEACDPKIYIAFRDSAGKHPDPEFQAGMERYRAAVQRHVDSVAIVHRNPTAVRARELGCLHPWQYLPMEESQVRLMWWSDAGTLHGLSGGSGQYWEWTVREGVWQGTEPFTGDVAQLRRNHIAEDLIARQVHGAPYHSGRQYLARVTAAAPWNHDSYLIGTADSMVGRVDSGTGDCFSLGGLDTHGPVHQIVTTSDRTLAYGISGDPMDLGRLFVYHDKWGLRTLGRMFHFSYGPENAGVASSHRLSALALSPDDRCLAIGSEDRLSCVYLLRGIEHFNFTSHLGEF